MCEVTTFRWTVAEAQKLFSEADNNIDMGLVAQEDKIGWHWVQRWLQLVDKGVPKTIAYDTVAVRARKSRRWVQSRVRAYNEFGADEIELYAPLGITFLDASLSRDNPHAFLDEALKHPNTVLDTLLAEFPAVEYQDEPREQSPYPNYLWGVGRRLATLPKPDRAIVEQAMGKITDIFKKNGIE